MQIALLTPWLVKCGVASYSYYLAHALAKQDCEVKVVRLHRFGMRDATYFTHYAEEVPLDVEVIHVQHEYGLYEWLEENFLSSLRTRLLFHRVRKPIVTTMHATGNIKSDSVIRDLCDEVVVHNKHGAAQFSLPCKVIPMGVQKVVKAEAKISKRRWNVKGKVVGVFGFISPYKGLDVIIDAVSQLKDVTLLIGGGWHVKTQTPYMAKIKMKAYKQLGDRVKWLGYIKNEDEPYFFGACDVMVYGHRFISESMSLMTALAYGKATLASNLPSFREKARNQTVTIFKDAEDLKGKIQALLEEPELRGILEKNAEKYAAKNSWDIIAKQHIKLYNSLLK